MPRTNSNTPGGQLAARYRDAVRRLRRSLLPGARELPMLRGLTAGCSFTNPAENVLVEAQGLLSESGRVFGYGSQIVLEAEDHNGKRLDALMENGKIERGASARLANIFLCEESRHSGETRQFAPPDGLISLILNREPTRSALPSVETYARRPLYDSEFRYCGPGWHSDAHALVHCEAIEAVELLPVPKAEKLIDRLPERLRILLRGFCFKDEASLANALAALLTGLLVNHFQASGKPMFLIDGNQPSIGKTLLVRVIGAVLDGFETVAIPYTSNDEELGKCICAAIRKLDRSVLLFDNARLAANASVNSTIIETNVLAPVIQMRILGESKVVERPNDLLWFLTMNHTRTSPDLVSRGVPIRMHYEDVPQERQFGVDPVTYASKRRLEILGELIGMVGRWNQAGCKVGNRRHRCDRWAQVIGGILAANGCTDFLTNTSEASAEFNAETDNLAALAEQAMRISGPFVFHTTATPATAAPTSPAGPDAALPDDVGALPADWADLFTAAGVLADVLQRTRSRQHRGTTIGQFLGQHVGNEFPVTAGDAYYRVRLCVRHGRARQKRYYFRFVSVDGAAPPPTTTPTAPAAVLPDMSWPGASATAVAVATNPAFPWLNPSGNGGRPNGEVQPAGEVGGRDFTRQLHHT